MNALNMLSSVAIERLEISQDDSNDKVILKAKGVDAVTPYDLKLQSEFGEIQLLPADGTLRIGEGTGSDIIISNTTNELSSQDDVALKITPAASRGLTITVTSTAGVAIVTPYGSWTINRDGIWFGNDCRIKYTTSNYGDLTGSETLADVITKLQQLIDILKDDHQLLSDP